MAPGGAVRRATAADAPALEAALGSAEGQAAAGDVANFATGGATMMIAEAQRPASALTAQDRLDVDDRRAVDRLQRADRDPVAIARRHRHPVQPDRVRPVR